MNRREFIAGLGSAAVWPAAARAQQQTKPTICWLGVQPGPPLREMVEAFRRGLAEVGFSEGRNVTVEYHTVDGHLERLPMLATDLVNRRPAAIVAPTGASALAAKEATRAIPIIFVAGNDPVALGLVASLNRPGGNLTGSAGLGAELAAKRLELLHKVVPAAEPIAMLVGPADSPYNEAETKVMRSAARVLGLDLLVLNVTTDGEVAAAFAAMAERRVGAILAGGSVVVRSRRDQIISLAARFAIPIMFYSSLEVRKGALLSYGHDTIESYHQVGVYTGRVLKGEKPADLPVVQPTKFDLAINLITAKALGLTIPETLLATADEVIQ
jgi:putative tryptophan/tyrosine transport system substrate-binding protein